MSLTENFNQDANGNIIQTGAGTAGTPDAGVVTIQGITGGTPLPTVTAPSGTATLTSVASSAATVVLLAANASRKGFQLYNLSTKTVNVAFAATATAAAFSFVMQANSFYENNTLYTGVISGIWSAVNGSMKVTELT